MEEQSVQPREHPLRLKILGILNVLYGVGLLLFRTLPFAFMLFGPRRPSFPIAPIAATAVFSSDSLFPILFIIGGIGLLRAKTWARVVSIVAAGLMTAAIILDFLGTVLRTATVPSGASEPWVGVLLSAIFNLILLIYPVVLIILLGRRRNYERHRFTND